MNIKKFINKIWTNEDKWGITHFELTNLQEKILELMIEEPYFIGELQRQRHGKTEMCLMYAAYMAARSSDKKITLVYHNETEYKNASERLLNRLKDTMLLRAGGNGIFKFHNKSTIRMTVNGIGVEDSEIVIIDEAAWFEEEKLSDVIKNCTEYTEVKILTSPNENSSETYRKIINTPEYTYLRYSMEED